MSRYDASYAPHPWDAIGTPPPLGVPYEAVSGVGLTGTEQADVLDLIAQADSAFEEYESLKEEADDARSRGEDLLDEARDIVNDRIEPVNPKLAAELMAKIGAAA